MFRAQFANLARRTTIAIVFSTAILPALDAQIDTGRVEGTVKDTT